MSKSRNPYARIEALIRQSFEHAIVEPESWLETFDYDVMANKLSRLLWKDGWTHADLWPLIKPNKRATGGSQ